MNLLFIWGSYILFVSYSEEFNQYQYFLASTLMFCLTYFYNQISYVDLPLRVILLLVNIPGLILWYISFVYNDFLAINPIPYEILAALFFLYIYLILYIILNSEFYKYNFKRLFVNTNEY